jgi:hypothetical protein
LKGRELVHGSIAGKLLSVKCLGREAAEKRFSRQFLYKSPNSLKNEPKSRRLHQDRPQALNPQFRRGHSAREAVACFSRSPRGLFVGIGISTEGDIARHLEVFTAYLLSKRSEVRISQGAPFLRIIGLPKTPRSRLFSQNSSLLSAKLFAAQRNHGINSRRALGGDVTREQRRAAQQNGNHSKC